MTDNSILNKEEKKTSLVKLDNEDIEKLLNKYPPERKSSAVLP